MKATFVFLACWLTVTLAVPREQTDEDFKACKEEVKIIDGVERSVTQENCFKACMFKKQGYMKADGTLDVDYMISAAPAHVDKVKRRKDVVAKSEECMRKAKGDACLVASCLFDDRS